MNSTLDEIIVYIVPWERFAKGFCGWKSLMMFSLFYNENVYFHNAKADLESFLFNVNFTFYEAFGALFVIAKI